MCLFTGGCGLLGQQGNVVIIVCIVLVHGTSSKVDAIHVGCSVLLSLLHLLTAIFGDGVTVTAIAADDHKVCKT